MKKKSLFDSLYKEDSKEQEKFVENLKNSLEDYISQSWNEINEDSSKKEIKMYNQDIKEFIAEYTRNNTKDLDENIIKTMQNNFANKFLY